MGKEERDTEEEKEVEEEDEEEKEEEEEEKEEEEQEAGEADSGNWKKNKTVSYEGRNSSKKKMVTYTKMMVVGRQK